MQPGEDGSRLRERRVRAVEGTPTGARPGQVLQGPAAAADVVDASGQLKRLRETLFGGSQPAGEVVLQPKVADRLTRDHVEPGL